MKEKFLELYPYLTELHCHTLPASGCSDLNAEETVALYKALGVDTLVLTNHFYNHVYRDTSKKRQKEDCVEEYLACYRDLQKHGSAAGMSCILGMEIRFAEENENDYLLYGIEEEDIPRLFDTLNGDLKTFYTQHKPAGSLLYQAHPFRNRIVPADPAFIDGVEVFNMHPGSNSRVYTARQFAHVHQKPMIGGSDCHHPSHAGACLLRTKEKILTAQQLVDVLRSMDYILDVGGSIVLP